MKKSLLVWICALGVMLAGSAAAAGEQSSTAGAGNENAANGAEQAGVANGTGPGVQGPTAPDLQSRTIYFDFDSSEIKPEYTASIAAHA